MSLEMPSWNLEAGEVAPEQEEEAQERLTDMI
jgi:hypothetical protein